MSIKLGINNILKFNRQPLLDYMKVNKLSRLKTSYKAEINYHTFSSLIKKDYKHNPDFTTTYKLTKLLNCKIEDLIIK